GFDLLTIKVPCGQVEVATRVDLEAPIVRCAAKPGEDLAQRGAGLLQRQEIGNNPEAVLAAFEPGLEIGHDHFEQILLRLVEETKVAAPGSVADDAYPSLSFLGFHQTPRLGPPRRSVQRIGCASYLLNEFWRMPLPTWINFPV